MLWDGISEEASHVALFGIVLRLNYALGYCLYEDAHLKPGWRRRGRRCHTSINRYSIHNTLRHAARTRDSNGMRSRSLEAAVRLTRVKIRPPPQTNKVLQQPRNRRRTSKNITDKPAKNAAVFVFIYVCKNARHATKRRRRHAVMFV